MAGPISQSESDRVYQRLQNLAKQMLDMKEEIDRLESLKNSLDLATNLDEQSSGFVTKAEAIAFFQGPITHYENWFDNQDVNADGIAGSNDRRAKIDPFLVLDNF